MAVKYTIPYRSIDDTPWRIDILLDSWTDDPITVRGHSNRCCTIEYDGGVDDPFDNPVVSSKAIIELINQGEIDMDELQEAAERDFVVEVYRDNVLKWKGYLITDNIQQPYQSTPYVVQLSAIDGLNMLEGITFSINNLPAPPGGAIRCPLNWLRLVLFREQNLGLMLPIRWYIGLENVATEDDPLAGLMTWSPYGEGIIAGEYVDDLGNMAPIYQNCRYILEGLVKCMKGARIFQADGAWNIFPPIDIIGGEFTYNECDSTLALPTITQHTVDINRLVAGSKEPGGDYSFIREDAILTSKPALSKVDVEYDADRRENILPNGGMDIINIFSQSPMYWGFSSNPGNNAAASEYESLRSDGTGSSVDLINPMPGATGNAIFTFSGGLPVDANLLFKRFTWGFTIMPLNGFTYLTPDDPEDPTAGTIVWDDSPLRVRVYYKAKDRFGDETILYLNRWGYWQRDVPVGGWIEIVNKNYSGSNFTVEFAGYPMTGDYISIGFASLTEKAYYTYIVTQTTEGNLAGVLSEMAATIPGASSTATTITVPEPWGTAVVANAIVKSGADNLLPGNWLDITVDTMKMGDVASVVFQGKGGNSEILFPDPGRLPNVDDEIGVLHVEFALLAGQRYVLDDVWVHVEDNNDVYRASVSSRGNIQTITLGISSSFSGFMVSNLMRSFNTSNTDFLWTDGTTEASLTEHYARSVMRWRYKPSKIFNGTINTRTKDWSFLEIYAFSGMDGRKFLPLNAKYNTEICEVDLVAMEGRDDGVITDVKHYASNNMPLSNYGG